jgi:hypothetical protein
MDVPATSGDLSEDNILKAQKKVLANLTKNPDFYFDKMCGKGEVSHEWIEATKKEIDKIGKGKKNIMREGIHDQDITSASHTNVKGEMGDYDPKSRAARLNKLKDFGPKEGDISAKDIVDAIRPLSANKEEIIQYLNSLSKSGDKFETADDYVEDFRNYIADKSLEEGQLTSDIIKKKYNEMYGRNPSTTFADVAKALNASESEIAMAMMGMPSLEEHGDKYDKVSDMNPLTQDQLKEKQEAIYEKYCEKTGIPMENLMSMVREAKAKKMEEAIALKDKAGNVQYAKDSTEASNIEKAAKTKGVTLTKSQA